MDRHCAPGVGPRRDANAHAQRGSIVVGGTGKRLLDEVQVKEMLSTTSGNDPQISREHIHEGRCVAIQTI